MNGLVRRLPKLSRLRSDAYYKNAIFFMAASLAASAINYLFYPVMARLLNVVDYGELQLIATFVLQLTTIYLSLNIINVNIVANQEESTGTKVTTSLQRAIFWLIAVICIILFLLAGTLQSFFRFTAPTPFMLVAPILLIDTASIFWTSYLQGHHEFPALSIYTVTVAAGKVALAILLVELGLGVSGGVMAIAGGLVLGLVAVRLSAKRVLPRISATLVPPKRNDIVNIQEHIVLIVEVIVSLVALGILLSADVFLVKHLFSPYIAGRYAGVSTVARIIFYASAPLVMVMLPSIKLIDPAGSKRVFIRTYTYTCLICLGILMVFSVFSRPLVMLLMGRSFVGSAGWLPEIAVISALAALTNVTVNFLLAIRSHWSVVIALSTALLMGSFVLWYHASIPQIIASASAALLLGQVLFWAIFPTLTRPAIK